MIDYNLINESIQFYSNNGFQRIEAPWTVSEYVDNITKPEGRQSFQFKHNDKCFVASGEQSFLYLYLKGFLPLGRYQCSTPCIREEPFDYLHSKYFIKNELIQTDKVNEEELQKLIEVSLRFFKTYLQDVNVEKTDIGYDIVCNGIELGSYGIRECEFLTWIYATGCAEPRLSTLINKQKK